MQIRRSMLLSALDRYAVMALGLTTTAVAARLLTPADIGTFVVGGALFVIADALRDFGVGVYLIQERELTPTKVRAAFTVTFVSSCILAILFYAAAPTIAAFYREARLANVVYFAAAGLLVVPFGSTLVALMRRDLAFGRVAVVNVAGAASNLVAVCLLAWLGFGYLSLVWGMLAASIVCVLAACLLRPNFWAFRPEFAGWSAIVRFGGYSSATTLINTAYQLLPQMALGRILGFDAVAFFSRSALLCQLPERGVVSAIQPVVLPALSARARAGADMREPYLHGITLMTVAHWPFLGALAVMAEPAVRVLLGEQWLAAVPLVQVLSIAYLALAPAFLTYPLLVSLGRVQDTLTLTLVSVPLSMAVVIGSALFGLMAMCASFLLLAPLQMYIAFRFVRRHVPFSWADLARAVWRSAIVTLGSTGACAAAVALLGDAADSPLLLLVVGALAAAAGWASCLALVRHPLRDELAGGWSAIWRLVGGVGRTPAPPLRAETTP